MANNTLQRKSAFNELGLKGTAEAIHEEIRALYKADAVPWVVGYSGGKDSTAVLQLVWIALKGLKPTDLSKPVHVISTDTLVENPVVALWVAKSLETMKLAAMEQGLPIEPHRLTPALKDSFWVNLIGKGYPAPRAKFRWCTERLKIKPSNRFILDVVKENGEAILVLGTRKAESSRRAARMNKLEAQRVREKLSPNQSLPNSLVYSPVEDWSNDDVWLYLMQVKNPWGYRNKDLLTMYQGASEDGECPLVVDTTTPSCGNSRFGCWVCTLVSQDRSMTAMIQNDEEKEWMLPLLELRNALDVRDDETGKRDDRHLRDFRRLSGRVELYHRGVIPGPYVQTAREDWLRRLLEAQRYIRDEGPEYVRDIELITMEELQEIRRIWVMDKHELEDNLPRVYQQAMGEEYPDGKMDERHTFGFEEMKLLREVCEGDDLQFELLRELLDVEGRYRTMARRAGLYPALEKAFKKSGFEDIDEATELAHKRRDILTAAREGASNTFNTLLHEHELEPLEVPLDNPRPEVS